MAKKTTAKQPKKQSKTLPRPPKPSPPVTRKPVTSEWVKVRSSLVHGRGLFATKKIPTEEWVIEYIGDYITKEESEKRGIEHWERSLKTGDGSVYIFELNEHYDIDGSFEYNTARLMNHSCDPNCEVFITEDEEEIWIVSRREIKKGEELTFNYGFDTEEWESYPCRCNSENCVGYICGEDYWDELKKKIAAKAKKKTATKTARKSSRKKRVS